MMKINKINFNKSGYSLGFSWVFAVVSLFGLGLLYITFDQVFTAHLVPVVKSLVNSSLTPGLAIPNATTVEINGHIDKYMTYFHLMPYVLFFVIILYMIISAIRREGDSEFR